MKKPYRSGVVPLGNLPGPTAEIDAGSGSAFNATLTGNVQFSVKNLLPGEAILVLLTQDATGGRTTTWNGIGGLTILNGPTPSLDPNRTTALVFIGSESVPGTVIGAYAGGSDGASDSNSFLSVVAGWLTLANGPGAANGVSIDALGGDTIRARIAAVERLTVSPTATRIISPSTFNAIEVADAGAVIGVPFGYVDITGVGVPGVTVNAGTKAVAHGRNVQASMVRRTPAGEEFWYDLESELSIPAAVPGATSVLTWQCEANLDYSIEVFSVVRDITNSQTGKFARRSAIFAAGGGAVPVQTGTTLIVGPAGTTADDRLGAALTAGPATLTLAVVGTTIAVQFNPVIAGPTNCFVTTYAKVWEARRA